MLAPGYVGDTHAITKTESYLDWVCVSVVVELCVALSVSQPVSDKRTAVAKQAMKSFFISIILSGLLLYKRETTQTLDHRLWGVSRPCGLRRDFAAHPLAGFG